jgi:tripartite-type tricarboxylate transporter receptor subunit TctC
MKFIKASTFCILAGALASMSAAGPADAQFYEGKRVNVIINYAAGGNTDIQGRSVLRHLEKYVPGEPRFLVRNISGAGGIVGVNFLGEVAKRDGYTIGIFTIPIMAQIMRAPELRVDLRKLQMIGAIAQQTISHIRKDVVPGGMQTWQDFTKITKTIKTAGHGPQSSKDLRLRMFMEAV